MTTPDSPERPPFEAMAASARAHGLPQITKLVVAIHGIGSQIRGDTIRSVARQFGDRDKLPIMPLGFFHIGGVGKATYSRLAAPAGSPMRDIGFLEVFWADIPRRLVSQEDTIEETKAWGKSVVSRARATYSNVQKPQEEKHLTDDDFDVGIGVIEEIVETIEVLENLTFLADKAGFFKFDLAKLLRDYVGDVQVVAEFEAFRNEILLRFHKGMAQVVDYFNGLNPPAPVPEIYVVAHSEGTVVSFLAMLQALSVSHVDDPNHRPDESPQVSTSWVSHVRGFMTIGSPIDKHLLLWPGLWENLNPNRAVPQPIKWRNYYDLGDPVGFRLETAEAFLREHHCAAFQFSRDHDYEFCRYVLPGKAHVGYWEDAKVFGHFIDDVVIPTRAAARPKTIWGVDTLSLAIPYLLTFLLHLGAVFALHKGISALLDIDGSFRSTATQVGLLGLLLSGITVAARIPRLTKTHCFSWKMRWRAIALTAFAAGAVPCYFYLPDAAADFVGSGLDDFLAVHSLTTAAFGKIALIVAAGLVASTGWVVPRAARLGRRVLVGAGFIAALGIVALQIHEAPPKEAIWPSVLAAGAFLYLWWLAILLFDLTFIWHRYIRRSVAIEALDDWSCGWDARPNTSLGFGGKEPPPSARPVGRWKGKDKN